MLLPRKWALSLGLLAAVPSLAVAGPLEFLKFGSGKPEATAQSPERSNQEVADEIGKALREAHLTYKDVQIEFLSGVATISGQIKDPAQRAAVTKIVSKVPGVQTVENRLSAIESAAPAQPGPVQTAVATNQEAAAAPVERAGHEGAPSQRVQPVNFEQQPAPSNQAVAHQIADALTSAGLSGYDIEVRYRNGVASLIGSVEDPYQVMRAHQAASSVPGVNEVLNRLTVKGQPAQVPPASGYGPMGPMPPMGPMGPMPPMGPMGAAGQPMPARPVTPAQYMQTAQQQMPPVSEYPQAGPQYGHVQPAGHQIYNQPNLPQYAWPTYAPYDNSAAISYPTQYDASAWPYIGPYYPYPQVPLGWRKSTLEWNDGSWSLKFDSRTDRWWWFLNPHNWH